MSIQNQKKQVSVASCNTNDFDDMQKPAVKASANTPGWYVHEDAKTPGWYIHEDKA